MKTRTQHLVTAYVENGCTMHQETVELPSRGDVVMVPTFQVAREAHTSSREAFNLAMLAVQPHVPPDLYAKLNTAASEMEVQVKETMAARLVAMVADLLGQPISVLALEDET